MSSTRASFKNLGQRGGAPASGPGPFRDLLASQAGGIILPAFIFFAVIAVLMVGMFSRMSMERSRQSVHTLKSARGKALADAGVQLALARLDYRAGKIPERLAAFGTANALSDSDVWRYVNDNALLFWTERLNGFSTTGVAAGKVNPNFALTPDGKEAYFQFRESSHSVRVAIRNANAVYGNALVVSGINDVTLRYSFVIESSDVVTGRTTRVESYAGGLTDQVDTLQIHLSRPLSRYNLFSDSNTLPSGEPVYDWNRYSGRVYSRHALFVAGGAWFDGPVEISADAVVGERFRYAEKDGDGWEIYDWEDPSKKPLKSDNSVAKVTVGAPVLSLPGSIEEDMQRRIAYTGDPATPAAGQPGAVTLPTGNGVYTAVRAVPYMDGTTPNQPVSVYVVGSATITLENELPWKKSNLFHIDREGYPRETVRQDVGEWRNPFFLIFVEGKAWVRGELSQGNKVTVASHNDLLVMGDVMYADMYPNEETVAGLLSWGGNVLISKDFVEDGQHKVQAVIMAPEGGFGAESWENFSDPAKRVEDYPINYLGTGVKGTIYHMGSIVRKWALPTLSPDIKHGWVLETQFDPDLENRKAPPYFPANGPYVLFTPERASPSGRFKLN